MTSEDGQAHHIRISKQGREAIISVNDVILGNPPFTFSWVEELYRRLIYNPDESNELDGLLQDDSEEEEEQDKEEEEVLIVGQDRQEEEAIQDVRSPEPTHFDPGDPQEGPSTGRTRAGNTFRGWPSAPKKRKRRRSK